MFINFTPTIVSEVPLVAEKRTWFIILYLFLASAILPFILDVFGKVNYLHTL